MLKWTLNKAAVAHENTFEIPIDFEMLCVVHHTQLWISQIVRPLGCRYVLTI